VPPQGGGMEEKMKLKYVYMALAVILVVVGSSSVILAQNSTNSSSLVDIDRGLLAYEYPITPDDNEWENMNPGELRKMIDIPEKVIKSMPTDQLVDEVLEYPYISDILAFDDISTGIEVIRERFSGLRELLNREDVGKELTEEYLDIVNLMVMKSSSKLSDSIVFDEIILDSLFTSKEVINSLSSVDCRRLLTAIETIEETRDEVEGLSHSSDALTTKASASASPGDIIGTATIFTPKKSAVTVYNIKDMSSSQKSACNAAMATAYPNASRITTATYTYNCHSYAWYNYVRLDSLDKKNKRAYVTQHWKLDAPSQFR
jgi:hypothetical protein